MATARRSATINVMVEAAEKAGRSLVRDFGEVENLQVSKKGPGNFVSTADHKAEKIIKGLLQKARPKFGFLMEESGAEKGEDPLHRWIVDPLDGTTNYLHGLPQWSVSIALEKKDEIIAAAIYDPVRDEMFWAEKGMGAYVNNRRLQVAGRTSLEDALIAAYVGIRDDDGALSDIELAKQHNALVRVFGGSCLDLAYVAAGRFDAAFKLNHNGGAWDLAAGSLLIKEARGVVTDIDGGKDFVHGKTIIAANAAIHAELMKRLKGGGTKAKAS